MQIDGLDHLGLTVADLGRTRDFYERVFGMEPVVFGEGRHALAYGAQKINLHEAGREFEPKAAVPTPGSADLCLPDGHAGGRGRRASGGKWRRDPRRTSEAHGGDRSDNVCVLQGSRRESHRGLQPPRGVTGLRQRFTLYSEVTSSSLVGSILKKQHLARTTRLCRLERVDNTTRGKPRRVSRVLSVTTPSLSGRKRFECKQVRRHAGGEAATTPEIGFKATRTDG